MQLVISESFSQPFLIYNMGMCFFDGHKVSSSNPTSLQFFCVHNMLSISTNRYYFLKLAWLVTLASCILSCSSRDSIYLKAEKKYSFCTKSQSDIRIGLVADKWALELIANSKQMDILRNNFIPSQANYYQGPKIYNYIGKSAGPRRPDVPTNKYYSKAKPINLIVTLSFSANRITHIEAGFKIAERMYKFKSAFPIYCSGPLP